MKIDSEQDMFLLGFNFAKTIKAPSVLELIGDVGAGKTTFTKGLASGLGIDDEITSPSFTISKRYQMGSGELVHYDFYRIDDPGIMFEELSETISGSNIVVIEWANSIKDLLPKNRYIIHFKYIDEYTRGVQIEGGL